MSRPTLPSPLEREWQRFKEETLVIPENWADLRAAFEYGFNRGIAYACSQIEWDIQERATEPQGEKHAAD